MDGNDAPVTLIIKAPTQQIVDQTIQCGMSWTIERLKRHISDVYPNKPNPADQRLIYYGQLLSDSETLQDILTRFEQGETVYTLHLVCIPSRESMARSRPASGADADADRVPMGVEPPAPAADPQQPVPPTPEDAYRFFMNPAGYQPWMNEANSGYFQQLAWAQQAYANYYISQYMDMLARQNGGQPMYAVPGAEREAPRAAEPAPQRMDDEDRNRDWLDYFYIIARLVVLLSIVYFYSSPARFMIVSFLGIVMYLYQVGFFRLHHMQALENNNEVFNNNVAAENNNLVQGEGAAAHVDAPEPPLVEDMAPQMAAPPAAGAAAGATAGAAGAAALERPSLLAVTWTFFSSFFASLIPENQNVV